MGRGNQTNQPERLGREEVFFAARLGPVRESQLAVCNDWGVLRWPFLCSQILKRGGTDFVSMFA